jgi:formate dehydrogenase major subunit
MKINRRQFLKISVGTAAGVMALGLGMDLKPVKSYEGALCSKGAALSQLVNNKDRLVTPLYRKSYSHAWQKVSWDWALYRIALNIKKTRDATFIRKNSKGQVVNRTEAIASVGSAALDNEECWPLQAMMRALGLVYIEHQARI